jgi:transcriptional regulator with XRE-family HTH domain
LENKRSFTQIGSVIRKYRKEKGLKLIHLASSAAISVAMLSKIENGRMIPTIPTLFSIIAALHIQPDVFFKQLEAKDDFPGYYYVPKKNYVRFVKEEKAKGFDYYSVLEHNLESGSIQVALLHLSPSSKRNTVTTAAYEFIYMISGSVKYLLGKKTFELKSGDSLFFDGAIPHLPVNESKSTAVMLVMYLFTTSA